MWTNNRIEVLSSLRVLLKLMNLYNKNGVHIGSVKIPDLLVFCLVAFPTFHLWSLYVWIVIEENFDLNIVSFSLDGVIGQSQITLSFILLAINTDLIASTIDDLQEFVAKSRYHLI